MKAKKYRSVIIFAVLSVLCVCFIFGQSMMHAKESMAESDKVLNLLKPILDPHNQLTYDRLNFIVRKAAHMTEFAALGICVGGLCISLSRLNGKAYLFMGPFLTLITAVTDEFIQSFSDRTSMVSDVLIDFSGALIGLLLIRLIFGRRKKS